MVDFLNKFKLDKQKIIFIVLFSLALFYIDIAYVIKSQIRSVKALNPQISKSKDDLYKMSMDISNFERVKAQQIQTRQKILAEAKKIISEEEIPSFLQDIYGLANKNGIKVMQINPAKDISAKPKLLSPEAQKLTPYVITLDLFSSYHSLGSFINELEKGPSFIEVRNLGISRSADPLKENIRLILGTYVKK